MKKALTKISIILVLLTLIVSCDPNTDGLFREISHASKESTYACKSYIGLYDGTHYVLTDKGILTFKLDSSTHKIVGGSEAMVDTKTFKSVRSAAINGSSLILVNAYGNAVSIDLSKTETEITNIGNEFSFVSKKSGSLCSNGVKKILYDNEGNDYIVMSDQIECLDTGSYSSTSVYNVAGNCEYAVIFDNNTYGIYKIESSEIIDNKLATLSGKPTASFIYDGKVYYKTNSVIEEFDTSTNEIKTKSDGWANDLCTAATSITEFFTLSGDSDAVYAVLWTGGIVRIDLTDLSAPAVSIF